MNRRDFLTQCATGAATLAATGLPLARPAFAQTQPQTQAPALARPLAITSRTLEVNKRAAQVFGLVQPDGTPGLTFTAGDSFDVALTSRIDAPTLIHWHGLTPPWAQDGVPGNPAAPLSPGEVRAYDFPAGPGGTHWMHAHTLQEQNLLAAPLIVRSREDAARDAQEVVILLHDFSFTPAEELLAGLRGGAGGMDHGAGGMSQGAMPGGMMGHAGMNAGVMAPGGMTPGGMSHAGMNHGAMGHGAGGAMDLNDIAYDAYLANDRTLDDPQVVPVEKGGRVRLRIINGASATAFQVSTGALEGEVIAVDGQPVQPLRGRIFPLSMGQRIDIRLTLPAEGGAWPILALREGEGERTGIVLATSGAVIRKLAASGTRKAGVVDLGLEQTLRPLAPLPRRRADRSYPVTLTGSMAGYSWAISGPQSLTVRRGERVEIAMMNMSMMSHPMHLHGHRFQVVEINGRAVNGAVRDTVVVPPMARVKIAFDADNPGNWPFHCHHLYHMEAGMMAFVAYEGVG